MTAVVAGRASIVVATHRPATTVLLHLLHLVPGATALLGYLFLLPVAEALGCQATLTSPKDA
ncbi:MAG TPA: hypothetical protein VNC23_13700 [Lapillicoccus sp.]|jgi:hypothetical protein|nr:hypothetical protein [Lapillicoccus sp.]